MDIVSALRTFLRVAETSSFSAAALDLGLTQPAVSRQVSALEARLNMRLLHRTTTALALTAEGERMIPMARRVLEAVEELGGLGQEGEGASGKARLSVPPPLGLFLSDRMAAFLARHPGLSVDLLLKGEGSDLVQDGIDLEVRLGRPRSSSPRLLIFKGAAGPQGRKTSPPMIASATGGRGTTASGRSPTAHAIFPCASRRG